jgi:NAD(P)-dependent dehydrogenase (short-subunit alcohol dehydrogenase family)
MTDQKIAIVTAAGKGIGAAAARELHARGWRLSLMSPSTSSIELAKELGGIGFAGSVTSQADVDALVDATMAEYGRVDGVINNTGWEDWSAERNSGGIDFNWDVDGHLLDIPDSGLYEGFELMFMNVVRMARAVTGHMRESGGGAILNISTPVALEPTQDYPISSMFRAMMSSFTKLHSDAFARDNIRMNTILVGYVNNFEFLPECYRSIPMGRGVDCEEMACSLAAFLSDDARYVSGENIAVDGGLKRGL